MKQNKMVDVVERKALFTPEFTQYVI